MVLLDTKTSFVKDGDLVSQIDEATIMRLK